MPTIAGTPLEEIGMDSMKIYTDGSGRANGNGGVGVVWVKDGKKIYEFSKGYTNTTNNRMELIAIYIALKSIKKPLESLEIISDSEYSIGVLTKPWNPKKNIVLIKVIKKQLEECQRLVNTPIKFTHVRGHQKDDSEDTKWNNYCDKLCTNASS